MNLQRTVTMAAPQLDEDEVAAATAVLSSGALRQGEVTADFERAVADYVGAAHAYACSSGTAALHLAYLSVLEPGDEVLVPALTFFATASAVALAGATPVFCDVDPMTFLIDLDDAATRITARTTAIAPVYLFGHPIDQAALGAFSDRHGLTVIGDAAQALGSHWDGRHVGAAARLTTHSFYPTKNLFVGEGGMVTTDDAGLDDLGRLLRSHGQRPKYHHNVLGLNYRLTDVEAAIGLTQLPKIEARTERRRAIAAVYGSELGSIEGIRVPSPPPAARHSYHAYTVVVEPGAAITRDELQTALRERGVQSQVNYPLPLHHQPVFIRMNGSDAASLPVAEDLVDRVLSIPVHHHLTDGEVEQVVAAVVEITKTVRQRS